MPLRFHHRFMLCCGGLILALIMSGSWLSNAARSAPGATSFVGQAPSATPPVPTVELAQSPNLLFLPLLRSAEATATPPPTPTPLPTTWLERVNAYRAIAGAPPVTEDAVLNDNCFQHARYMAENNHLTHNQNPDLPWASPAGQSCAQRGNAWISWNSSATSTDAIDGWMRSVEHRFWLLYPTTRSFGFGIYGSGSRAAGALDVLSRANFSADTSFTGWPIRYPADGQQEVPNGTYPISLLWRQFTDGTPTVTASAIQTADGTPIAHTINTSFPATRHRAIVLTPSEPLPSNTTIVVHVIGTHLGEPFDLRWSFTTR
jgi:uncharacterized protein YkwD